MSHKKELLRRLWVYYALKSGRFFRAQVSPEKLLTLYKSVGGSLGGPENPIPLN